MLWYRFSDLDSVQRKGREVYFFQGEKVAYYSLTLLMFPLISECYWDRIMTALLWKYWCLWKLLLCNALNEYKTLGKFLFLYPLWFPGSSEASRCLIHPKSTIFFEYYKCNPLMLKRIVHVISKYTTYTSFGIWTKITTSNPFRNLKRLRLGRNPLLYKSSISDLGEAAKLSAALCVL